MLWRVRVCVATRTIAQAREVLCENLVRSAAWHHAEEYLATHRLLWISCGHQNTRADDPFVLKKVRCKFHIEISHLCESLKRLIFSPCTSAENKYLPPPVARELNKQAGDG